MNNADANADDESDDAVVDDEEQDDEQDDNDYKPDEHNEPDEDEDEEQEEDVQTRQTGEQEDIEQDNQNDTVEQIQKIDEEAIEHSEEQVADKDQIDEFLAEVPPKNAQPKNAQPNNAQPINAQQKKRGSIHGVSSLPAGSNKNQKKLANQQQQVPFEDDEIADLSTEVTQNQTADAQRLLVHESNVERHNAKAACTTVGTANTKTKKPRLKESELLKERIVQVNEAK